MHFSMIHLIKADAYICNNCYETFDKASKLRIHLVTECLTSLFSIIEFNNRFEFLCLCLVTFHVKKYLFMIVHC